MSFVITYEIFCDLCSIWIGDGCRSKEEVKGLALRKGWKITRQRHVCPTCKA